MPVRPIIAWSLVAGVGVWAAFRLFGLEAGYPLVPLIAFTPIAAVLAAVVVVVVAALRQWRAAGVALALTLLLGATIVPRAVGGPTKPDGPAGPELTVLNLNLKLGGASPEALLDLVRRTHADVLALEEVSAQAIIGLDAAGVRDVLPHRLVEPAPGDLGTALFSTRHLADLPRPPGTQNPMATAAVEVPGAVPVTLTAVHTMAPTTSPRARGWATDFEHLPSAADGGPVRILLGDFNATLDHKRLRTLIATGYNDVADQLGDGLKPTWPVNGTLPGVTIDHVLADEAIGIRAYRVYTVPGTDHHAVMATVELPAR